MNTKNIYLLLLAAAFLVLPSKQASAAVTPLAIAIVPPLQFPPSDFDVVGLRLSILWGKHRAVRALDLGLVGNMTENDFVGLAIAGGFNRTEGDTTILGLQLAGITNMNMEKTTVLGIQASAIANYNKAESKIIGLGLSAVNLTPNTTVYGAQAGLYNKARSVYGFQIGVVNMTEDLHGIQIGLLNFNDHGMFKVSPILNVGF